MSEARRKGGCASGEGRRWGTSSRLRRRKRKDEVEKTAFLDSIAPRDKVEATGEGRKTLGNQNPGREVAVKRSPRQTENFGRG